MVVAASSFSRETTHHGKDIERTLLSLFKEYCEAVYSRSRESLLNLYAPDAELHLPDGHLVKSNNAIVDYVMESNQDVKPWSCENTEFHFNNAGDGHSISTKYKVPKGNMMISGYYTQTWMYRNGRYRIVQDAYTVNN